MSVPNASEKGIYFQEAGAGEPLLLIPGWGGSIEELSHLRRALSTHYRVIAADPPGSGRSGPQPRRYTPSYYSDDAKAFLTFLRDLDATPAHVVGHSDGGEYALLMAAIDPQAVRSIVTWGSAGRLAPPPGMLATWRKVVDEPIPPLQHFSDHLKNTYGVDNSRVMVATQSDALEAIVKAGGDLGRGRADEIRCPTLMITGENDVFAPPSLVSEMVAALERAEFVEVKGGGHPLHMTHAEWLTSTIVTWLSHQ